MIAEYSSPGAKATSFIHHSYDGGPAGKRGTGVTFPVSRTKLAEEGASGDLTFLGNPPLHEDDHGIVMRMKIQFSRKELHLLVMVLKASRQVHYHSLPRSRASFSTIRGHFRAKHTPVPPSIGLDIVKRNSRSNR